MKKNKVANTPLRKRNKKEPIWVALQLKRDERLDKVKRTRREDTTLRLDGETRKEHDPR